MAGHMLVKEKMSRVQLDHIKRYDSSALVFRLIGIWILILEIIYLLILTLSH
jgi:hypothetical protein